MRRYNVTYDIWECDKRILSGGIETVCEFLDKSVEYIHKAVKDARRINGKYTVTSRRSACGRKSAKYILWCDNMIVGMYSATEIASACSVSRQRVQQVAKTGEIFAGRYEAMDYNKFSDAWERDCRKWRRT